MIFVTVGTQLSFDRLIRVVDEWAGEQNRQDIVAQIGPTELKPANLQWSQFVDTEAFRRNVEKAEVIVSHAGMGSIITALELAKPIVVMPRRADLGEHRNEHQLATARRFAAQGRISVAFDEAELKTMLNRIDEIEGGRSISTEAEPALIDALSKFIHEGVIT